jgi:tRNA synthetases class I (C) catalytic domain
VIVRVRRLQQLYRAGVEACNSSQDLQQLALKDPYHRGFLSMAPVHVRLVLTAALAVPAAALQPNVALAATSYRAPVSRSSQCAWLSSTAAAAQPTHGSHKRRRSRHSVMSMQQQSEADGAAQTSLLLYNTASRSKQQFKPQQRKRVTFYSCGPTVYDSAHIGNFRAFLTYDVLKRWLTYRGFEVRACATRS